MNPLEAILIELAIAELRVLIPELGEILVAAIAGLVSRLKTNNPAIATVVADASNLAMGVVRDMEQVDWGDYFSDDEIGKMKAQAALNELLGRASDDGIKLATNDAELLIRNAVEVLRTKVKDAVAG